MWQVILIDASDESMKARLLGRGKSSGRSDDNEAAVAQRLEVYHSVSEPVVSHYEEQGKLERINSEGTPEAAFDEIKKIFDEDECVFDFDDGNWFLFGNCPASPMFNHDNLILIIIT